MFEENVGRDEGNGAEGKPFAGENRVEQGLLLGSVFDRVSWQKKATLSDFVYCGQIRVIFPI